MKARETIPKASKARGAGEFERRDEDFSDRRGEFIAVSVLAGGLILLLAWAHTQTTFEQCRALKDHEARMACYDAIANKETQPAKGALAPVVTHARED